MRKSIDHVNQKAAQEAAPRALAGDVFEAIHSVMHLYRAAQYRDSTHGLTHMEGKVLGFFARSPGATQKDLAEHSGRDKGQLARLIGGLKERGLLEASTDEADRRSIRLQTTSAGRSELQRMQAQGRRQSSLALSGLDVEEQRLLLDLLTKVQRRLEIAD